MIILMLQVETTNNLNLSQIMRDEALKRMNQKLLQDPCSEAVEGARSRRTICA
jgi:hypothetical protein